jgi:hypothetical protein
MTDWKDKAATEILAEMERTASDVAKHAPTAEERAFTEDLSRRMAAALELPRAFTDAASEALAGAMIETGVDVGGLVLLDGGNVPRKNRRAQVIDLLVASGLDAALAARVIDEAIEVHAGFASDQVATIATVTWTARHPDDPLYLAAYQRPTPVPTIEDVQRAVAQLPPAPPERKLFVAKDLADAFADAFSELAPLRTTLQGLMSWPFPGVPCFVDEKLPPGTWRLEPPVPEGDVIARRAAAFQRPRAFVDDAAAAFETAQEWRSLSRLTFEEVRGIVKGDLGLVPARDETEQAFRERAANEFNRVTAGRCPIMTEMIRGKDPR